jgi:hypothetical protein
LKPFAGASLSILAISALVALVSCGGNAAAPSTGFLSTPVSPSGLPARQLGEPVTVSCAAAAIDVGIDGETVVPCTVTASIETPIAMTLTCAAVPGFGCGIEPAAVTVSNVESPTVNVAIRYSEATPFGSTPLQLIAQGEELTTATTILLNKDVETLSQSCPSAASIAKTDLDFRLVFEGDPTGGRASDCPASQTGRQLTHLQARAYRSLAILRQIRFDAPLPFTPLPPYEWLKSSIRGMRFRTDIPNSSCCQPEGMINIQVGPRSSLVFTPPGYPEFLSTMVMSLFVHEARHNNGKLHTCGLDKDRTLAELGAYGAQFYFERWVIDHTAPGVVPAELRPRLEASIRVLCSRFCEGGCGI